MVSCHVFDTCQHFDTPPTRVKAVTVDFDFPIFPWTQHRHGYRHNGQSSDTYIFIFKYFLVYIYNFLNPNGPNLKLSNVDH